ncbi:MAG: carboxypeptidase-like regulatory domain-containing protein [Ilumatobacteraceae bacterium]
MRVDLLTPVVSVRAKERATISIQVRNDDDVIEQVVGTMQDLDPKSYEPVALNLFPGEVGELRLVLSLPEGYPAGRHVLHASITASVRGQTLLQPVAVDVEPLFDMLLVANPSVITAKRRGRYLVTLQNRGNHPVEMAVRAADSEAALTLVLDRPVLRVEPGFQETTALDARGKRPWFGAPVTHTVDVTAERLPDVLTERLTLRLRPRLTAGVLTALTLGLIVAVWATALLLSANAAFGSDKPTKTVPGNFAGGVSVASLDPAAVGGTLGGTVTAASNGAPLARITVEMYGANQRFVTAVASGSNGAYALDGVLPGRYRLRFRGPGFEDRWFPDKTSATDAQVVEVAPKAKVDRLDQAMPGGAGELNTTVVTVDGSEVPVTVEAQAVDVPDAQPVSVAGTAGQPVTFPGLVTPATYRIKASSAGYLDAEVTQEVAAGQTLTANPISLGAQSATISGTVVGSDGSPLGDITVSTTVNDAEAVTVTPTNGAVGTFSFSGLPTPATYVLELSGTGVATKVVAVRLEANQSATGQTIQMSSDSAVLGGVVSDGTAGVGGATVTVSGGGFTSTATTFTANPPGSYTVTGVPTPGTYVVTVSAPGRVSASTTVTVAAGQATATADLQLQTSTGRVFGTVTRNGTPVGAATVTVSDGTNAPASTVSATVGDVGSYEVGGLAPGIYSVTATYGAGTANTAGPVTVLVTVAVDPEQPGSAVVINL